jgi:hypothetical protein
MYHKVLTPNNAFILANLSSKACNTIIYQYIFFPNICYLKVHKIEIFFGFDFEIFIISLIVM